MSGYVENTEESTSRINEYVYQGLRIYGHEAKMNCISRSKNSENKI